MNNSTFALLEMSFLVKSLRKMAGSTAFRVNFNVGRVLSVICAFSFNLQPTEAIQFPKSESSTALTNILACKCVCRNWKCGGPRVFSLSASIRWPSSHYLWAAPRGWHCLITSQKRLKCKSTICPVSFKRTSSLS
jgi:hypothetical protein